MKHMKQRKKHNSLGCISCVPNVILKFHMFVSETSWTSQLLNVAAVCCYMSLYSIDCPWSGTPSLVTHNFPEILPSCPNTQKIVQDSRSWVKVMNRGEIQTPFAILTLSYSSYRMS